MIQICKIKNRRKDSRSSGYTCPDICPTLFAVHRAISNVVDVYMSKLPPVLICPNSYKLQSDITGKYEISIKKGLLRPLTPVFQLPLSQGGSFSAAPPTFQTASTHEVRRRYSNERDSRILCPRVGRWTAAKWTSEAENVR